jgi:hypothetical protein
VVGAGAGNASVPTEVASWVAARDGARPPRGVLEARTRTVFVAVVEGCFSVALIVGETLATFWVGVTLAVQAVIRRERPNIRLRNTRKVLFFMGISVYGTTLVRKSLNKALSPGQGKDDTWVTLFHLIPLRLFSS